MYDLCYILVQVLDDLEEEQELYEDEGNLLEIHEDWRMGTFLIIFFFIFVCII